MSDVASRLVATLAESSQSEATVLTLSGNLGAGKTTLVQALACALGVVESVQSPTFVVMKQYRTNNATFTNLVHIDAYRIEDSTELETLHFSALLTQPSTLICIEWPEHIAGAIPASAQRLQLHVLDEQSRKITGLSQTFSLQ